MAIRLVVFDVGETLVDETRMWGEWADWLGVGRLAFFAALGAVIAGRRHHREVYELVRPGIDIAAERAARGDRMTRIEARDLYPDAVPTLTRLRAAGYGIGLAGNQPADAEVQIRGLGLSVDFVASSARWGVEKPDPLFFQRIVAEFGRRPGRDRPCRRPPRQRRASGAGGRDVRRLPAARALGRHPCRLARGCARPSEAGNSRRASGGAGRAMKIVDVRTYVLEATLAEPFAYSQAWYETRGACLVEIVGEDGNSGWGEAFGPARLTAPIVEFYKPLLVGEDALATERHWQALYNRLRDHGRKGLAIEALSAVDIALWDLKARHFGVSVARCSAALCAPRSRPTRPAFTASAQTAQRTRTHSNISSKRRASGSSRGSPASS